MRTLVFLLATILLGGCASSRQPSVNLPTAADFTILVRNSAFRSYVVYTQPRNGGIARLGRVEAASEKEFKGASYLRNKFVGIRVCEMNGRYCYNIPGEVVGTRTVTFDVRIHERVQLSTIAIWNW